MTLDRLKDRVELRKLIDAQALALESPARAAGDRQRPTGGDSFDAFYEKALTIIQSNAAVRAFRLEEEPAPLRERYGRTRFGQSLLLARRLIEAETRFVQVTWPARSDDEPAPGPDGSWDTHRNNFPTLRNDRCPVFDHSLSALLEDMHERSLLKRTLVVAIGEFGRSPKIGAPTTNNVGPGGRDHWPDCYSCLITGGGVRPGEVYGESDRFGAYPATDPVTPGDLAATLFHVGQAGRPDPYLASTLPQFSGTSLGRFRILRPHAKGGLGQVSVALDQELNREVALKEIQPQHADSEVSRERFVLEAEITGGLEHPGIVPVYALGQGPDGRPFYAMRFVKGDSLKQAIEAFHHPRRVVPPMMLPAVSRVNERAPTRE
jgi:hypothetical protein